MSRVTRNPVALASYLKSSHIAFRANKPVYEVWAEVGMYRHTFTWNRICAAMRVSECFVSGFLTNLPKD